MNQVHSAATAQLELFSSVLHAYSAKDNGVLDNRTLYERVAKATGKTDKELNERVPIGAAGALHNPFARKVRWYQQTLKTAGILERVESERGVWSLTKPASKDLNKISPTVSLVGFSTDLGVAILGCAESVFASRMDEITLVITSPPYPLHTPRAYGNPTLDQYVDWICKMLEPVVRNLVPGGSICLNLSNDIFEPGMPARSIYREELVVALHRRLGLWKMDELIWHNPSKPPGPLRYASIDRTQLNVAWEPVYWFTNDPRRVKSNNRRVLQPHTERHLDLIHNGGEQRTASFSDGAYLLKPGSYGNKTEGRIPRNILTFGHRCSAQTAYKKAARELGLPVHGAPFPLKLASFLIEFLSEPGDLVADLFMGSFTVADAAERLGRRWLGTECMIEYVLGGSTRFTSAPGFRNHLLAA
jgi:DNA modification methylase